MKFNFDYSKTMMMKMLLSIPDNKGNSKVFFNFEQALEKIKKIDNITAGAPKIIYLVGWQYQGHDDKYPAFFEVNEALKRPQDSTALESLLWLIEEAKKYHTVVSFHINLSDAYPASPLWDEYMQNNLIMLNAFGKPKVTGNWNNRKTYQVRFAEEYRSGYFQKRVDKLLELLPIKEAGTVHIDAFFVRKGKHTKISEEKIYRRKMIEYFMDKGIDVTSEFIYREHKSGFRAHFGKSDTIGIIPAVWNLVMTQKDYLTYSPDVLAGGELNMDLQHDKDLQYLFYGNMHGEDCMDSFEKDNGLTFTRNFALKSVPYFFLNHHRVECVNGKGAGRTAVFSGNVTTSIADRKITDNASVIKENSTLCIPIHWTEDTYYAFSEVKCEKTFKINFEQAQLFKVTPDEITYQQDLEMKNSLVTIPFEANTAYLVKKK